MTCVQEDNINVYPKNVDNLSSAIEKEKHKQLVTLVANIIVDKIINNASQKGYQVPEVQPR
jgi:hypothetical protein